MIATFGSNNNNPSCEHFVGIDENKVSPTTTHEKDVKKRELNG